MARILVVDDSESVFFFVRRELADEGHIVDRLAAFTELASYLRRNQPDLILLDLEMPAMSGTVFAQFLRRIERSPTRILVHSSLSGDERERAAHEIAAAGAIEKGPDGEKLRQAIRNYLSMPPPQGAGAQPGSRS